LTGGDGSGGSTGPAPPGGAARLAMGAPRKSRKPGPVWFTRQVAGTSKELCRDRVRRVGKTRRLGESSNVVVSEARVVYETVWECGVSDGLSSEKEQLQQLWVKTCCRVESDWRAVRGGRRFAVDL
jgi:hypothetical protein